MKKTLLTLTSVVALATTLNAQTVFNETFTSSTAHGTENPSDWDNTWTITNGYFTHWINTNSQSVAELGRANSPSEAYSDFTTVSGTTYSFSLNFDNYAITGSDPWNFDVVFLDEATELSRTTFNAYNATGSSGESYGVDLFGSGSFLATSASTRIVLDSKAYAHGWVTVDNITVTADAVPEPSSSLLLGLGGIGLLARRKRS